MDYLPRLPREYYQGDAVVHWTLTVFDRKLGWLSKEFHTRFRELMFHASSREGLICPTYCLMPDHLHLMWMGLRLDSDQINGMAFLRTYLEPALSPAKFQPQPHDHVLRTEERTRGSFSHVCFYVLANPINEGLVTENEPWEFAGAIVPGYPTFHPRNEDFWEKSWPVYSRSKHPDAGNINRPPI